METVKLGSLVGPDAKRDAVHVAVFPVQAGERLRPGDEVELFDGKAFRLDRLNLAGIVDPFLQETVHKDEWFYLCIKPGTVTSLRHAWTHPNFPDEEIPGTMNHAKVNRKIQSILEMAGPSEAESEKWLRDYAVRFTDGGDFEHCFQQLISGLVNGRLFRLGRDLHDLSELSDVDELKLHAENYLGIKIDWNDYEFSCSC